MANKKVLIIGGGLGGLAVGSYLQMNGYNTHILEMANQCGGVVVTWQRKGYTFDGATNYLPGSSPGFNIHNIIGEILDLRKITFYDYPEFICVEYDHDFASLMPFGELLNEYITAGRYPGDLAFEAIGRLKLKRLWMQPVKYERPCSLVSLPVKIRPNRVEWE